MFFGGTTPREHTGLEPTGVVVPVDGVRLDEAGELHI